MIHDDGNDINLPQKIQQQKGGDGDGTKYGN